VMPTVGHDPAGIDTPFAASFAYTSASRAPAPMRAVPGEGPAPTALIGPTSTTSPDVVEYPA